MGGGRKICALMDQCFKIACPEQESVIQQPKGASSVRAPSRKAEGAWAGGAIALLSIYLPSFLLVAGALPLLDAMREQTGLRSAILGVNAAVAGILAAALYDPVWKAAIGGPADLVLALAAFGALVLWKLPSWAAVLLCASGGLALRALGV